jgi:hypothetical protein
VEKHFGDSLTLIIFFDSSTRTGDRRRKRLPASKLVELKLVELKLVELQKTLNYIDLTVPSTVTTVILSSYQTWARRTTREIDLDGNGARPVPPAQPLIPRRWTWILATDLQPKTSSPIKTRNKKPVCDRESGQFSWYSIWERDCGVSQSSENQESLHHCVSYSVVAQIRRIVCQIVRQTNLAIAPTLRSRISITRLHWGRPQLRLYFVLF